ncbi:hypothetical protein H9P43_005302 [Blastocladiella emersonii ATCC 22665]|nr:hypothetical protein H9P43_005277 [Blastocladiella emersonii ATCC 22665]KAI9179970.1 hypothetical protein H9P43_005302 [Blastocladiella emersonii ATCC 22665]
MHCSIRVALAAFMAFAIAFAALLGLVESAHRDSAAPVTKLITIPWRDLPDSPWKRDMVAAGLAAPQVVHPDGIAADSIRWSLAYPNSRMTEADYYGTLLAICTLETHRVHADCANVESWDLSLETLHHFASDYSLLPAIFDLVSPSGRSHGLLGARSDSRTRSGPTVTIRVNHEPEGSASVTTTTATDHYTSAPAFPAATDLSTVPSSSSAAAPAPPGSRRATRSITYPLMSVAITVFIYFASALHRSRVVSSSDVFILHVIANAHANMVRRGLLPDVPIVFALPNDTAAQELEHHAHAAAAASTLWASTPAGFAPAC